MPIGSWVKLRKSGEIGKFAGFHVTEHNSIWWIMTASGCSQVVVPYHHPVSDYIKQLPS